MHSFQYKLFGLSKTKIVFTTRHESKEKMKKCLEYPHSILERNEITVFLVILDKTELCHWVWELFVLAEMAE